MYRIYLYFLLSLAVMAQGQTGPYSISGIVSNSATGEPVKNALVTLNFQFMPRPEGGATARAPIPLRGPVSTLSGVGGDFVFSSLPEGRYSLAAQKPGFTFEPSPTPGMITLNSSLTNASLKLSPLGVIEGKVIDREGEVVPGVNVVAISVNIVDGMRITKSQRSVSTNDVGGYRLWNLQRGKYYIKAAGRSGGTFNYIGDGTPAYDSSLGTFPPVYSGGAQDLDSATPVTIGPGTRARADIDVTREPSVRIRGVLSNFEPTPAVKFELLRGEEDVSASRVLVNTATGKFEIEDVTPGTYLLRATQGTKARVEVPVTIGDRDLNNVSLPLSPGVTVKAFVHSLETQLQPVTDRDDAAFDRSEPPGCQLSLRGSSRNSDGTYPFTQDSEGELKAENVLPGAYHLGLSCFAGYVLSALSGATDLLSHPTLIISPGVAPAPIDITVKDGGGAIEGKLIVDTVLPQPGVLLIPSSSATTGPVMASVYKSPAGLEFRFQNLSPGDYTLYAFSQRDEVEYRNPLFIQSLRGGTNVHVNENDDKELSIASISR